MSVTVSTAGEFEGKRVDQFRLESEGVTVDILTWGVAVRDWRVPVNGGERHVALGFDSFEPYPKHSPSFGCIPGRVANRIKGAGFDLDGEHFNVEANWHGHTLHGGSHGLGRIAWDGGDPDSARNAVRFHYFSQDGEMGFPGNVHFEATYSLSGHRLKLEMTAKTDRRTPINLTQHQYFNLGTGSDVLDHRYRIAAPAYTELGELLIPTGAILPTAGTRWDFTAERTMRDAGGNSVEYDGNLVLATGRDLSDPIAVVKAPDESLTLRIWTDRPGVQLYNSVTTNVQVPGIGGRQYGRFCGFCLEDQDFPDAVHNPHFPSIIYEPGRDYAHWSEIEIA